MRNIKKRSLILAVVFSVAFSAPCWGGKAGEFATALKNRFCSGTSGPTWYACYAYMHYRVDLNKKKNDAQNVCNRNGCESKYSGDSLRKCKEGCNKAYTAVEP